MMSFGWGRSAVSDEGCTTTLSDNVVAQADNVVVENSRLHDNVVVTRVSLGGIGGPRPCRGCGPGSLAPRRRRGPPSR